jgi:hypothetical protein
MKTNLVRQCSLIVAAGLIFSLGCARPSAQPEQPRTVAAPTAVITVPPPEPSFPVTNTGKTVDAGATATATADTNAPAILERIAPAAQPEAVALSPGLSEIAKLAQAGVAEDVILAYVEKYEGRFDVGADQILYLNDLGVSGAVITSMLKHDGSSETAATLTNQPPSLVQTQIVSNVPQNQILPSYAEPAPEQPAPQVATQMAPPPTSAEVSYFYDTLSPYGSWIYVSGYGWCWQPTVAVSVPTWRPYMDRGRWYWSDAGWYWASDYSWGWAPFHYGRWYHHPRSGWLWTPGTVWGPSWVSWRYSDGYCGWAPLPPEALFVSGVGFTFHSRHVSIGFDFGLSDFHYSFVHLNNFCDYSPYRYVVPRARVQNFYRNTTVINNYIVGNNNTVINRGIGRETVARSSQTRIREVSVRDRPVQNVSRIRGDQIERQGNQLVAYRPQLPKEPPQIRTAQFVNRSGAQSQPNAAVGRNGTAVRSGSSGTANLSGTSTLPATGGRVPSSVSARPARETTAQPGQQRRVEEHNGRATVSQRGDGGSVTAVPGNRANDSAAVALQNSAAAQAQYQRQQQLRSGPLFGSTVNGGTPQPGSSPASRRPVETRSNPAAAPRAQAGGQQEVVQPNPRRSVQAQAQSQNNVAVPRSAEARTQVPVTPRVHQSAPQPQYQSPQYNAAASRPATRVYPQSSVQVPAAQVQPRDSGVGRTVSPRQSEQPLPRYSAPVQQAPHYSAPAERHYSAPRQESRPAPAQVPSGGGGGGRGGGGGGGGREASPSRAERAR